VDKKSIEYFRGVLLKQGERAEKVINSMEKNREAQQEEYYTSELSKYDNHPADTGSQLYELEHNLALKLHQEYMLQQVSQALQRIEDGNFGTCTFCGSEIPIVISLIIIYSRPIRMPADGIGYIRQEAG
jgi:RNA polymerase-binding transcription factor DksA